MDSSRECMAWMPALADGDMYKNNLIVVVSAHQEHGRLEDGVRSRALGFRSG